VEYLRTISRRDKIVIASTRTGFIAEDMEESIAAPGAGEIIVGVGDVVAATVYAVTLAISLSIIFDSHAPAPEQP
jgi:hypothetical protein